MVNELASRGNESDVIWIAIGGDNGKRCYWGYDWRGEMESDVIGVAIEGLRSFRNLLYSVVWLMKWRYFLNEVVTV